MNIKTLTLILTNANGRAMERVVDHAFVTTIVLVIGLVIAGAALFGILKSGMKAWKNAKEQGENKWLAVGVELVSGLLVIGIIIIGVQIPLSGYVRFLTPLINIVWGFLVFLYELFTNR